MGCSTCATGKDGKPAGCKSNGGCQTGGCNRLNTYDWLATREIYEPDQFDLVEVSFKNGARKQFFQNNSYTQAVTGDMVVVDTGNGYDVGQISLSGDLVRLQMRKKRVKDNAIFNKVIRRANDRDLEKLKEARSKEAATMVRARAIARTLGLEMKIGDVEYQGDKRKATFYYTAEGRVDFRELIRHYAKEFRVKIEMRQIGARQESARIGGIGSCGRELCCSTWLTDFKSVSTAAARYQNLAINQSKLSGQCGRLKCCLNYELDSYMDALQKFPKGAEVLKTEAGEAGLIKTDIFKGLMYYVYRSPNNKNRGKVYMLELSRVKDILEMNRMGKIPAELTDLATLIEEGVEMDFEDVTGAVELPPEQKRKRNRRRNRNRKKSNNQASSDRGSRSGQDKKHNQSDRDTRAGQKSNVKKKKKGNGAVNLKSKKKS